MEPIDYRDALDRKTFLRDYHKPNKPVILKGALERWYAADVWRFEWFRDTYRDLPVTLRFPPGPGSTPALGYEERPDTLGRFVEGLLEGSPVEQSGYLASLRVEDLPALQPVAVFPDFRWMARFSAASAWLGPAGTVTSLHCDLIDNLFAQVRGRKRFKLYRPPAIESFGPRQYNSLIADPRQRDSPPEPDHEFVLEERELLYIPPFYWHHVVGLKPSICVNLVWYTPQTLLRDVARGLRMTPRRVANKLRAVGH